MQYRILGPLEVDVDGEPVPLGPAKERALLGVLLLHANEVVSVERLVDDLWGENPPSSAPKVVQVYVSQLRRRLNGAARVVTRAPGYLLAVGDGELDATRFEKLVAEARALADRGRDAEAVARFDQALSLWRGPVLADVALESLTAAAGDRLDELRLAAMAERIDCELACGHHERVVGELERLVAEYPRHERFRAQLMLALYRAGRQADALAAYQDGRRLLVDELGIEPGPQLRELGARSFARTAPSTRRAARSRGWEAHGAGDGRPLRSQLVSSPRSPSRSC